MRKPLVASIAVVRTPVQPPTIHQTLAVDVHVGSPPVGTKACLRCESGQVRKMTRNIAEGGLRIDEVLPNNVRECTLRRRRSRLGAIVFRCLVVRNVTSIRRKWDVCALSWHSGRSARRTCGGEPACPHPSPLPQAGEGERRKQKRRRNLASGEAQAAQPRACRGLLNGRVFEMGALAPTSRGPHDAV